MTAITLLAPDVGQFIGQLMIALYRSGGVMDALEICRKTRQRLADELGLDPGPELARLELSLLRGSHRPSAAWVCSGCR